MSGVRNEQLEHWRSCNAVLAAACEQKAGFVEKSQSAVLVSALLIGLVTASQVHSAKAIIVDSPDGPAADEELLAHCRERLAGFKCPTSIDRIDALPRNPSGKILKTELREPYWRGHTRRVN